VPPNTERQEWKNLTAKWTSGVNCGNSENFTKGSFDYVIFTLANWGGKESWKEIWKSAFFALKPEGKLVFIEWKKYYDETKFMQALGDCKISAEYIRL
jgi:hypothetical protein